MKEILFVIPSLNYGGIEKSFINLLDSNILKDYNIYVKNLTNVNVYKINQNVTILPNSELEDIIFSTFSKSVKGLLKKKKYWLTIKRVICAILKYILPYSQDQIFWSFFSKDIDCIEKKFDIVIAYADARTTYYTSEKTFCNKKICWIHTDHIKAKYNLKFDEKIYKQFNIAICVSDFLKKQISNIYPFLNCKTIYNIVPYKDIIDKSLAPIDEKDYLKNEITLLSVGRISWEKGFDLAAMACHELIKDNFNFKWYIIGDGNNKKKVLRIIKKYNLENNLIILGFKDNPYPYIANCDLYIQPSRYEGFSTTVMEAMVLSKNIVITNVSGSNEQKEMYDGIEICEINVNSIKEAIEKSINKKNTVFNYKDVNKKSEKEILELMG